MEDKFVVLASNASRRVAIFGTRTGRLFKSEFSAQRAADKYENQHPTVGTLVLRLEEGDY